ncbi:MAG: GrpB family protein [Clostridiales bacterium]|jgi:GrpB-like predicted nucleotidyltransferase (UPF0157 family)|nr:GrpB family protein [Clostridiales bacterium]
MHTSLDKLSNEQFQKLYPIILCEHDPQWAATYEFEKKLILSALKREATNINHYGSTSVPGLLAKPSIDILLEIREGSNIYDIIFKMAQIGYTYISRSYCSETTCMFFKGYSESGFAKNVFHLHMRYPNDWDELYFCNYLKVRPDLVKEYSKLKLNILKLYLNNRKLYTAAKTDFIIKTTSLARYELGSLKNSSVN